MASSKPESPGDERRPGATVLAPSLLAAALPGLYLLLTSTTSLIPGIWPYDAKRILQFLLLLALFVLPIAQRRIRRELGVLWGAAPGWLTATLLGLGAWGLLSAAGNARSGMHALASLSDVVLLASLVLAIPVLAACRRIAGDHFDRVAVSLLVLTGLAVGFQELLGAIAAFASGSDFNFRISLLHFSWPRFYNQVQTWILPVMATLPLLFARHRLAVALCLLALGLQWYIILMTGARGSFVSLAAAFVFAVVLLPAVRRPLLGWQGAGLLLGVLIYAGVMLAFESQTVDAGPAADSGAATAPILRDADRGAGESSIDGGESSFFRQSVGRPLAHTSGRTWMWPIAVEDARSHPFLGIGPMGYACVSPAGFGHPHNFALQLAAEWGLPAAVAAAGLFLALLWLLTARLRAGATGQGRESVISGLLLTGLVAAALHSGLSGVLVMPASQVAGLIVAGLLVGRLPVGTAAPAPKRAAGLATAGLAMALFLAVLGSHQLVTMEAWSERLPPQYSLYPRLWQDAKVCLLYPPPIIVDG